MSERKLTIKQELFVDYYLTYRNASKAAVLAGYNGSSAEVGYENLRKPHIKAVIERRLKAKALSADEVVARLSDFAMGNIALVADIKKQDDLIDHPYSYLVKKIKTKTKTYTDINGNTETETEVDLEVHDPVRCLEDVGKFHALFTDKVEIRDWRKSLPEGVNPDTVQKQFQDIMNKAKSDS